MAIVTKDFIENFIATHSEKEVAHFIGRALVVIFNNQTEDEKRDNETRVYNNIGFTGADGRVGALGAKSFLKNGTLLDWQVDQWTKRNKQGTMRIAKYWRQLNKAAERKAQRKEAA